MRYDEMHLDHTVQKVGLLIIRISLYINKRPLVYR